ncbi:MAG: MOP flippase family protein [Bacteroidales bacterium]|nr:MOP flippase family protein [Bacteroidales bacterium]
MYSLKNKTVNGLLWSAIDNFANLAIQFIVGVILARILTPHEFGLIGMLMIFIAISQSIVNSGFSQALIRKNDCTNTDYSTVFYFNLAIGVLFYFVLYFSSGLISDFFDEPQLSKILKVLSIIIVVESFTVIQRTILTKRVDFKLQAKISFIATFGSGILAIVMAYNNYGVWSLVALHVGRRFLNSLFLWLWNRWKPLLIFSTQSFKDLFGFGSKLLLSGLIDTIYRNIYYIVIGKFFSAEQLGYYTRADEFKRIPSENLNNIIGRVSFPVLAEIQNEKVRLKSNYQKLIRSTMLITFTLMIGMAAVARPMVLTLIGDKWEPSIIYLQMLCFVGMMYPLHALNLNMLQVSGRSDLFLKLEVIKKIIAIPTIIIGIIWGIKIMIVGMMINTLFAYYLNSYWSGLFIGYSFKEQVLDILPSFGLALAMGTGVFFIGKILPFNNLMVLIIQVITGAGFILTFCEITKFRDYTFIKDLIFEKINQIKK